VIAAAERPTKDARVALATLCQIYWHPIYAFIRRNGDDRDQARDLTQAFFAVLLEKNYLRDAQQKRGRFRAFLLTAVKHFLANQRDREQALKRGGGQVAISIDPAEAESWYAPAAVDDVTPERLYERRWALSMLDQVMSKLRAEFVEKGKADYFDQLAPFLDGDTRDARYETVAAGMGVAAGALRTAVHRMRRKFGRLLREEIAETVSEPEEIDDEIRFILATLSS